MGAYYGAAKKRAIRTRGRQDRAEIVDQLRMPRSSKLAWKPADEDSDDDGDDGDGSDQ